MYLNKAIIIGNLTKNPELKSLPSGTQVANFSVATNRVWKNQQGEKQEEAQFHNIVLFGRQAEVASQYLTKGSSVLIEGRIQTRSWDAQDGTKKYMTEIVGESMQLGPRRDGQASRPASTNSPSSNTQSSGKEELDTIQYPDENINPEEIPF
jgi:single-strand DNA-binding protein